MTKTKPPVPKPHPVASQNSWADRVRVSDSSTRFTLEPLPRQPLGHNLKITEDMLTENSAQWNRCMIGFFPGFRMPFHAVNSIASRAWRQYGLETVMTTGNGFMIFRFNTEEEMHSVLEKGPWMFGGKNIILQQWHPRFQFDKNKIATLPVWVRLHGLPFPLWSKQGLSLAASMVGRPLSCDELTYSCTRLEYARLCVEVDAALPFIHSFEIDSPLSTTPITVTVDYEWKPPSCDKCKVFGHSCSTQQPPAMAKGKAHAPPVVPVSPQSDAHSPVLTPTALDKGKAHIELQHIVKRHFAPPDQSDALLPSTSATIALLPPVEAAQPLLIQHTKPIPTLPMPITEPVDQQLLDDSDSSQDSGNDFLGFLGLKQHQLDDQHANICLESKMDSLRTISDTSSAAQEVSAEVSVAASTPSPQNVPIQSPTPSPTTVRKKKGGRKKKEARGH
ncbi:hypothetical protein NC652_037302 [Populus alba x Populus x berolinensis]|uniref:DUF4283 domain-containing protein n=1 Tax=Populus alba TaxID=43335 RepID=A0A4U5PPZ7_POPAL|nr:hypothetical protein NC652_037302 [Populus alba x Populus x berolinensis]TKR99347.1 hypothetical protein D5086_0000193840 [Populus alba]